MSSSTSDQPDTTTSGSAGTSQELVIQDKDKLRVLALHGESCVIFNLT